MSNPRKVPSGPWTAPQDPEKPNCPYFPHFAVEIKEHIPPPPFGCREYGGANREMVSYDWLKSVTQTEHVLKYHPLQTASLSNPNAAQLTITKSISIGNSRGAQLAVCSITPKTSGATPFKAVAKIFDPLYYAFSFDFVSEPVDTVQMADQDYSREASAYEHLRKVGHTGPFTPQYFGSWTFNLPILHANKKHLRPVRLVLIEYLDGSSMRDLFARNQSGPNAELDASHYDKGYRLGVLAQLLGGIAKQKHAGLNQKDLAPRNVMIVPSPYEKPVPGKPMSLPRVVLVDYNNSIIYEKSIYGKPKFMASKLPRNPMQSYWNYSVPEFSGWIPEWDSNPKHRQEWLRHQFGESGEYTKPELDKA